MSFKVPRLVGIEFFYTGVQRFVICASHWNSRVGYSINCQANLLSSTKRVIILITKHQSFNQIIEFSVSVVFNVIIFSREFKTPSVRMMFIPTCLLDQYLVILSITKLRWVLLQSHE